LWKVLRTFDRNLNAARSWIAQQRSAPAERPDRLLQSKPNGARPMADYIGTSLDIEHLNGLSARLIDHADGIENVTARTLEQDLRTAARVADEHAIWRFAIAEITVTTSDGTAARALRELIGKEG
jgi:hypothetical protein